MDGTELEPAGIGKCGIGCQEIARQPGVGLVTFSADSLAVGAALVGRVLNGEEVLDISANQSAAFAAEKLAKPLIGAQNAARVIVNQDGVTDGIEGVFPLALDGGDLFKQSDVLQRQPEQVCDVDKISQLVRMK